MTADFDSFFDAVRPRSWGDAFLWLPGASEATGDRWWEQPIDETDPATRRTYLATISELATRRLARWTIGQIFPGLALDADVLRQLPARLSNVLGRCNVSTCNELLAVTLEDMMNWRQVGVRTVDAILQALADLSLSVSTASVTTDPTRSSQAVATSSDVVQLPEWMSSLSDDLNLIARWYSTAGLPGQPLLGGDVPPGTPGEVIKARQRLEALTPSDVLSEAELDLDVAGLFEHALSLLDPRAVHVLSARLFADEAMTLDQLGRDLNVTRERVRQIEGKARGTMLSVVSETGKLTTVAASARDLIGNIRPLDDLLELVPALAKQVRTVGKPAWRVLDRLDDAYEIEDGWCVVPTMRAAKSLTQTRLQEGVDQYGVIRVEDVDLIESSHAERVAERTTAWLTHCGYVIHGEFVLTRTSSIGDYAAAVLALEGAPLSTEEVADRFVIDRSARSIANALGADERFDRVDRDRWALREWGMEAYTGIRSIIRDVVVREGGRAKLNDVIEYITARYSVSSNSVIAYAAGAPFATKNGIVQLDAGDRTARKAPERTRRLFRGPNGWAYRVRITTDHLRGSGSVAPMAIATILGLQAGQTVHLESPLGPQSIAWTGIQPSFGSIRRFLMNEDVTAGTEVFLLINDDGTFGLEQVRELVGNPLVDALSLIGAVPTFEREVARAALLSAIGLPKESPVASLIGGYRSRGDDDIAELLLSVREYLETGHAPAEHHHSADVDDILDLL